ncbi:MAG: hypothetical protein ACT4NY_09030 [Pseudonocardiales bacterium]
MLDFFRGRYHWAKFHRLLTQLPRHSRFQAAQADDDEAVATVLAEHPDLDRQAFRFGLADWTYERELLTDIAHAIRVLRATLIAVHSRNGKGPKVPPPVLPVTAWDRIERRRTLDRHEARKRALLGG